MEIFLADLVCLFVLANVSNFYFYFDISSPITFFAIFGPC